MNQKHISMELMADGARVTNMKLDGGKLILTIEAELADSQLTASDVGGSATALAASLLPSVDESSAPAAPAASPSSSSGRPTPDTGIFTLTPPPQPEPAMGMELPTSPFGQPGFAAPLTPAPAAPAPAPFTLDAPPMFAETPVDPSRPTRPMEQHKPISFGEPVGGPAPVIAQGISSGIAPAPGISIEQPQPFLVQPFEPESPNPFAPPAPAFDVPVPAPAPAPAFDMGGITLSNDSLSFAPPPPVSAPPAPAPQPQFQQPAPAPALDMANPFGQPQGMSPLGLPSLAVSEESNVFGGARHGEPQPAISFGQDLLGQPAAPAPAPQPQPSFVPGLSLDAALPPQQPQNSFGFAAQSEPAPAPVPQPQPMQMAQPEPPAPPPAAPAPAPEEKQRPEAGGTTVLIRYTCPKCKTQGMQAVDKVGTVVNCSNCGKAMRLVMKK